MNSNIDRSIYETECDFDDDNFKLVTNDIDNLNLNWNLSKVKENNYKKQRDLNSISSSDNDIEFMKFNCFKYKKDFISKYYEDLEYDEFLIDSKTIIVILGIPKKSTFDEIKKDFEVFGKLSELKVIVSNGYCKKKKITLRYENKQGFINLLKYNELLYRGHLIRIEKSMILLPEINNEISYKKNNINKINHKVSHFNKDHLKVFINNLCYKAKEKDIKSIFYRCGQIVEIKIFRNKDGTSKGCGFIEFDNINGVKSAMEKKGYLINNRRIDVKHFQF